MTLKTGYKDIGLKGRGSPEQIPKCFGCEIGTWGTGLNRILNCPNLESDIRKNGDLYAII